MPPRLFVLVVVVVCLVIGCSGSDSSSQPEEGRAAQTAAVRPSSPGRAEDTLPPDLMLPDLGGQLPPLRTTPDAVTLLNFWATWCVPCLKELPELVAVQHQWQARGVEVVGIAIDSGAAADIRVFAAQHGLDYRLLIGTSQWARTYFQIFGLPVTMIVDRPGQMPQRLIGPHTQGRFGTAIEPYVR